MFDEIQCSFEITKEKKKKSKAKNKKTPVENVKSNLNDVINKDEKIETSSNNNAKVVENKVAFKIKNQFINVAQDKTNTQFKDSKKGLNDGFPYKRVNSVLTDAEKQLYHFLRNNLTLIERIAIFPKVRLADIIEVDVNKTVDKDYLYKIACKHVDFLIVEKDTLDIICVIELDDYTHNNDKARDRDFFVMEALRKCGIETARIRKPIKNISKEDIEYADEIINTFLAPTCPYCGIQMLPKKSRVGHRFWSCKNYMNGCRYTIDIDDIGEKLP